MMVKNKIFAIIINYFLIYNLAIKYYRAAMQLVPNIEFVMARKNQQPQQQQTTTTTMEFDNQQ